MFLGDDDNKAVNKATIKESRYLPSPYPRAVNSNAREL
jgi:hypothetical protein